MGPPRGRARPAFLLPPKLRELAIIMNITIWQAAGPGCGILLAQSPDLHQAVELESTERNLNSQHSGG